MTFNTFQSITTSIVQFQNYSFILKSIIILMWPLF